MKTNKCTACGDLEEGIVPITEHICKKVFPQRTKFEQGAFDIQKKKPSRSSLPHEIETYTGGKHVEHMTTTDAVLLTILGIILLFGIMAITK